MCFEENISNSLEFYNLEPSFHHANMDIVEAMNMFIQERNNHNQNIIKIKVSRKTQKVENCLANEESGFAFFSIDLG